MDTLRKRVPFKFSENTENGNHILDEQEQEEVLRDLHDENVLSSTRYLVMLKLVLLLSFILQLVALFGPSDGNPLLRLLPPDNSGPPLSIPYPRLATLLALVVHFNLALLAFPDDLRVALKHLRERGVHPFSYRFSYIITAVAPALSIFQQRPWQTTTWWSFTVAIVFVTQTVTESIDRGNEMISELEALKYRAAGA